MREIGGRTAVVIGGGSGIGRGVAVGLAEAGARVVVADIELAAAEAVAAEAAARGARTLALPVDATSRDSLAALAARADAALGPIHILSNNVGVMLDRPLDRASEADWAWVMEFGFYSIVRAVDVFLPRLRAAPGEKQIVNTASMAAVLAQTRPELPASLGLYTASKHAVLGYSETLRSELAEEGIGVSVLCPGLVLSNLAATSARHRPARYGGPLEPPGAMPAQLAALAMDPLAVGPIVVRAIRANRLHIFTHPERRKQVEARQQRVLDDFAFAAGGN